MHENSRTRSIVLCGLSIALLAVGAFVTVPVPLGLTPFTLQTLMLFIILLTLRPKDAVIAVAGYLMLGAIGMPIFAGMTGGFARLVGPTGGFLVGYLLAALAVGGLRLLMERGERLPASLKGVAALDAGLLLLACAIYFSLGTVWYSINMGIGMQAALAACVLPFIITEPIKLFAAVACVQPVRAALGLNARQPKRQKGSPAIPPE